MSPKWGKSNFELVPTVARYFLKAALNICLEAIKFVLLSFFTLVKLLKIWAKPLLRNVKSPPPVNVRRSKTFLLKFSNLSTGDLTIRQRRRPWRRRWKIDFASFHLFPRFFQGAQLLKRRQFGLELKRRNRARVLTEMVDRDLTKLRRRRQRERQKRNRFNEQNNNSARASRFFYISLQSLHNYDVKWPNFKFTWERKRQGDKFYHLCQSSGAVPSFQFQPKFPSFK